MRARIAALALIVALTSLWVGLPVQSQVESVRPAVRLDPVPAIVDAFRTYSIVAFPRPFDPLLAQLFASDAFSAAVDDLVVEFGNARSQGVMDRFQRGEAVSDAELRRVWLNSTDPLALWQSARYEAFFRQVREVNARRPRTRPLRVLLGDPPIDWTAVRTTADYQGIQRQRDSYPADLIQREVLAKGRRALLLYAPSHYARRSLSAPAQTDSAETLVARLERVHGARVFTLWPTNREFVLQQSAMPWTGGVVLLKGTVLGVAQASFYTAPENEAFVRGDTGTGPNPALLTPAVAPYRMEDAFDALLTYGYDPPVPPASSALLCTDGAYVTAVLGRMTIAGVAAGERDRLSRFCSPLQRAFEAIAPDVRELAVIASTVLTGGRELQVVVATPGSVERYGDTGAAWHAGSVLALVVHGPGTTDRILTSLTDPVDGCCWATVMRMTPTEVVLSVREEKTDPRTVKFFVNATATTATRVDYAPLSFNGRRERPDGTVLAFANDEQEVHLRPTATLPYIEIVESSAAGAFGVWQRPGPLPGTTIDGFTLPQSRPPLPPPDGPWERIGPTVREGTRIWFGKTFIMQSGVGGFGYFDTATGRSELFSPPAMRSYSVSVLHVEPDTLWVGLVNYGDWGEYGGGLLRVRSPAMDVEVIPIEPVVYDVVRFGGRLYAANTDGVAIVSPDGTTEQWFVDLDQNGRPQLARSMAGLTRRPSP